MAKSIFNARDFGALGNAKDLDTSAIQQAIETCAAAGGGKVLLSAGRYLSGTLFLRDNVTLCLSEGCELIACADIDQYPEITFYEGLPRYQHNCRVLIYAEGAKHCGVGGKGVINGQDELFWNPIAPEDQRPSSVRFRKKDWRPFTIAFNKCEHVHVEDITIQKSSVYAAWIVECNQVRLQNVTVNHNFYGPNTDGFHLSSCQNAFISGCSFYAGDDCIAIDGNATRGNVIGDNAAGGANGIVISNCVFQTLTNAVRIYTNLDLVEDESVSASWCTVKNVSIQNCVVKDAGSVLNVVANNGTISNVVVSGISVTQELPGTAIFFLTQNGKISNIDISHIVASGNGAAALMGDAPDAITGVSLSHCRFEIASSRKEWELEFPPQINQYTVYHQAPWMLHFRYVRQLSLDHLHVEWNSESLLAPPIWNFENVEDSQESFLSSSP